MKSKIIATSGNLKRCSIEGCEAYAVAFLQIKMESAGRKQIKSIGYCKEHATQKHEQLLAGPHSNYQPESFNKPHKLQ